MSEQLRKSMKDLGRYTILHSCMNFKDADVSLCTDTVLLHVGGDIERLGCYKTVWLKGWLKGWTVNLDQETNKGKG